MKTALARTIRRDASKKDKAAYLQQMRNMLIELDAAEVAKGHHADVDALKAKLEAYKSTHLSE